MYTYSGEIAPANRQPYLGLQYYYPQQQQQNNQQQQMNPMSMMSQFMGGQGGGDSGGGFGGLSSMFGFGGGETAGGGAIEAGTGLMSTGGSAGSTAGSSSGGFDMAGGSPWAALAAIILGNELYARNHGDRDEDEFQYAQDVFSGEVLGQDIEKRILPEIGIDEGSKESKWISHLIHPVSADLGASWESFKDLF